MTNDEWTADSLVITPGAIALALEFSGELELGKKASSYIRLKAMEETILYQHVIDDYPESFSGLTPQDLIDMPDEEYFRRSEGML